MATEPMGTSWEQAMDGSLFLQYHRMQGALNVAVYPGNITGLYFFEYTTGLTDPSLTAIIALNATYCSLQLSSSIIQVKTPYSTANGNGTWYVSLF